MSLYPHIQKSDKTVFRLIELEAKRQSETLMMIPSENYASRAVEEALSSPFGNKYAEGYPGKRYYQGNGYADALEELCINRAKDLFHVPFANVQPHSGSPANLAVLLALLQSGDVYMGLSLSSGGHLTHGAKSTLGSKFFTSVQYGVKADGFMDYDAIEKLAIQTKPKLIITGTTAYARCIDWKRFASIARRVDAYLMADISHLAGLIIGGAYPSPVSFADIITTTTHKTLRGPRGAMIMVTEKGIAKNADLPKLINSAIIPGIQGGPHLNSIASLAVALKEASTNKFEKYAKQIVLNAKTLAQALTDEGFKLITAGTDSHLLVSDMTPYGILGNTMAEGCESAGIILNRNTVPNDPYPPFYPSGIRFGTPALTTRKMKEREMKHIASWLVIIAQDLSSSAKKLKMSIEDQKRPENRASILRRAKWLREINLKVLDLCKRFPIPESHV